MMPVCGKRREGAQIRDTDSFAWFGRERRSEASLPYAPDSLARLHTCTRLSVNSHAPGSLPNHASLEYLNPSLQKPPAAAACSQAKRQAEYCTDTRSLNQGLGLVLHTSTRIILWACCLWVGAHAPTLATAHTKCKLLRATGRPNERAKGEGEGVAEREREGERGRGREGGKRLREKKKKGREGGRKKGGREGG